MTILFVCLELQILAPSHSGKNIFFRIWNKIFSFGFMLNICYMMFVIFDIVPSCFAVSGVSLLENDREQK